MARGGVHATLLSPEGAVLADSDAPLESSENPSDEPEFRQALAEGQGRAYDAIKSYKAT